MLDDRRTTLSFDRLESELLNINNGIRKGDPSSMILYLIYSHALVAIPSQMNGDVGAYVDDTFTATGNTFDDILNQMLDKKEMWSLMHNSHAETSKDKCLRLTHRTNIAHHNFRHHGSDTIIRCVESSRLLGVEVDQELWWHQHAQLAKKKGPTCFTQSANSQGPPSASLPHMSEDYGQQSYSPRLSTHSQSGIRLSTNTLHGTVSWGLSDTCKRSGRSNG